MAVGQLNLLVEPKISWCRCLASISGGLRNDEHIWCWAGGALIAEHYSYHSRAKELYHMFIEMQLARPQTASAPDGRPKRDRWRLTDVPQPQSRRLENRGRAWLIFGFIFCPCHLPITMAVLGGVVGSGVLGAAVRDAWTVGIVMVVLYGLTLWRGFAHLRRAKEALPPGKQLVCGPSGACEIESPARPFEG
jgi:MerE protein